MFRDRNCQFAQLEGSSSFRYLILSKNNFHGWKIIRLVSNCWKCWIGSYEELPSNWANWQFLSLNKLNVLLKMRQNICVYHDRLSKYTLTTFHITLSITNSDRVLQFGAFKAVHLVCLDIGIVSSPFWKSAPHLSCTILYFFGFNSFLRYCKYN